MSNIKTNIMKTCFLLFTMLLTTNVIISQKTNLISDERDGEVYKTVEIGDQWWMAENLKFKTPKSYCYKHDSLNCLKYGRLYLIDEAKNACPSGWHLPSDDEWKILEAFIGIPEEDLDKIIPDPRGFSEGKTLIEDKSIGLNIQLSGDLSYGPERITQFLFLENIGVYWTSTERGSEAYWFRSFGKEFNTIGRKSTYKDARHSVRCVKNE